MPPPAFHKLLERTQRLEEEFKALSNCYFPPDLSLLLEMVNAKINNCNFGRSDQAIIFRTLFNKLNLIDLAFKDAKIKYDANPDVLEKKVEQASKQRDEAVKILLGALLYRFLRLKSVYSGEKPINMALGMFPSSIYKPDPTNSALYNAIRSVLGEAMPDDLTIYYCLSSVSYNINTRNSGNNNDSEKKESILSYEELGNDASPKLKKMIEFYGNQAKKSLDQIYFIRFLVALAKELEQIHCELEAVIQKLSEDFVDWKPLSTEDLKNIVQERFKKKSICQRLEIILDLPRVKATFPGAGWKVLREALETWSQFSLFGAFIVVLDNQKRGSALALTLSQALNPKCQEDFIVEPKERILAVTVSLKEWLILINDSQLSAQDCLCWGGSFKNFSAAITRSGTLSQFRQPELQEESPMLSKQFV